MLRAKFNVFLFFAVASCAVTLLFLYPIKDAGHAASWMQAIGSVIAIFASLGMVLHQLDQSRISKESAAAARVVAFVTMLKAQRDFLDAKISQINREPGVGASVADLRKRYALLQEWLIDARGISFESLSFEWLTALNLMRANALQMAEDLKKIFNDSHEKEEINGQDPIFDYLKKGVVRFCAEFDQYEKELRRYPSVPEDWQYAGITRPVDNH